VPGASSGRRSRPAAGPPAPRGEAEHPRRRGVRVGDPQVGAERPHALAAELHELGRLEASSLRRWDQEVHLDRAPAWRAAAPPRRTLVRGRRRRRTMDKCKEVRGCAARAEPEAGPWLAARRAGALAPTRLAADECRMSSAEPSCARAQAGRRARRGLGAAEREPGRRWPGGAAHSRQSLPLQGAGGRRLLALTGAAARACRRGTLLRSRAVEPAGVHAARAWTRRPTREGFSNGLTSSSPARSPRVRHERDPTRGLLHPGEPGQRREQLQREPPDEHQPGGSGMTRMKTKRTNSMFTRTRG
jgi:hypothetical protein